jgi:hypothetical protein
MTSRLRTACDSTLAPARGHHDPVGDIRVEHDGLPHREPRGATSGGDDDHVPTALRPVEADLVVGSGLVSTGTEAAQAAVKKGR